ncbi:MAG: Yip1 family protein [Opitutae bacterium]
MKLIDRVKNILLTPKTEWDVINAETAVPGTLLTTYVLPLALVAAAGQLLGGIVLSRGASLTYVLIGAVIAAAVSVIGYFVAIHVIDLLAPTFGSEKNLPKSAQLVAYSMTPSYIAGLLSFLPGLGSILGLAGMVYSIYIMFLGVGLLKKTPEDKKVVYLLVAWVVMFVITMVISMALGAVLYGSTGYGSMRPLG